MLTIIERTLTGLVLADEMEMTLVQCVILSQVIRLNPSNAQAYVNWGVAQYRLGYHLGAMSGDKLLRIYADLQKASEYYEHQGKKVAYEKTLDLLKNLRQQISSVTEIALF